VKTKILALLFLLFILLIIVGADNGSLASYLRGIYDFPGGDKIGHFVLYGIMAFLLARAFPQPLRFGCIAIPLAVLALLVFAALEEYSQKFFSTRTSDIVDFAFTFVGIATGTWLASLHKKGDSHLSGKMHQ
jgi:VanZ family protein